MTFQEYCIAVFGLLTDEEIRRDFGTPGAIRAAHMTASLQGLSRGEDAALVDGHLETAIGRYAGSAS